jgi:hypothetical protein
MYWDIMMFADQLGFQIRQATESVWDQTGMAVPDESRL